VAPRSSTGTISEATWKKFSDADKAAVKKAADETAVFSRNEVKNAESKQLKEMESKGAKILALIGRPKGASLTEIRTATDWQAHGVRGFPSTAAKKHGLKIESTKTEAGDRTYRIAK